MDSNHTHILSFSLVSPPATHMHHMRYIHTNSHGVAAHTLLIFPIFLLPQIHHPYPYQAPNWLEATPTHCHYTPYTPDPIHTYYMELFPSPTSCRLPITPSKHPISSPLSSPQLAWDDHRRVTLHIPYIPLHPTFYSSQGTRPKSQNIEMRLDKMSRNEGDKIKRYGKEIR